METRFKAVRTEDEELVASILTHPTVLPHVIDDGVCALKGFINPTMFWITVYDEGELLGMFLSHPHNSVTYESHTCLLPNAYGARAVKAAHAYMEWMFKWTGCQKLITNVPEYNKLALRFARKVGGVLEGCNRQSFLKDGVLMDQYVLGITKGEFLCQHSPQ
jgi:RimJ/RimL family protein N-acetyltransferase